MSAAGSFMPGFLRRIGKRHVELGTQWFATALTYGGTAVAAITYTTEWKLILQYLPYYNGKFAESE